MSLSPDALAQLGEFNLEEARGDLGFIRAPGPGELAAADLSADEISGLRSWDFSGALAGLDSLTFEAAHPHEETNNEVRKKKFFRQAVEGLANFLQDPFGIKSRLAARSAARGAAVSPAEEKGGIRNWFRRKDRISIEASQSWWKRLGATAVAAAAAGFALPAKGWGGVRDLKLRDRLKIARPEINKQKVGEFLEVHGPWIAGGLVGLSGAAVVTPEMGQAAAMLTEAGALATAGVGYIGLLLGSSRGPEAIPDAESKWGRPVAAIRRLCSNSVVRATFKFMAAGGTTFAISGAARYALESLRAGTSAGSPVGGTAIPQVEAAPHPPVIQLPVEPAGNLQSSSQIQEMTRVAGQQAQAFVEQSARFGQQVTETVGQLGQNLAAPDVSSVTQNLNAEQSLQVSQEAAIVWNNPNNLRIINNANDALEAARQYQATASAGGFDAAEQAHLQSLIDTAHTLSNLVADISHQAVEAARTVAEQIQQAAAEALQRIAENDAILNSGDTVAEMVHDISAGGVRAGTEIYELVLQSPASLGLTDQQMLEITNAAGRIVPKQELMNMHQGAFNKLVEELARTVKEAHQIADSAGVPYGQGGYGAVREVGNELAKKFMEVVHFPADSAAKFQSAEDYWNVLKPLVTPVG